MDQNTVTGSFTGTTPAAVGRPVTSTRSNAPATDEFAAAHCLRGGLVRGSPFVAGINTTSLGTVGLSVGQGVTGPGIPAGTTILTIYPTFDEIRLSKARR